ATYSFRGDEGCVRAKVIGAGWLSCTGISPPAPDGVNTISCLVERFCNRSEHVMGAFAAGLGFFERYITCSTQGKPPYATDTLHGSDPCRRYEGGDLARNGAAEKQRPRNRG